MTAKSILTSRPAPSSGNVNEMLMMGEYTPTKFIYTAAKFQQKTRDSIHTWLVQLWKWDDISLTRQETEKMSDTSCLSAVASWLLGNSKYSLPSRLDYFILHGGLVQ